MLQRHLFASSYKLSFTQTFFKLKTTIVFSFTCIVYGQKQRFVKEQSELMHNNNNMQWVWPDARSSNQVEVNLIEILPQPWIHIQNTIKIAISELILAGEITYKQYSLHHVLVDLVLRAAQVPSSHPKLLKLNR